ncbi:hypothetical protein SK128_009756 [Halocaridina rubra]|uniref:Uncharacterized protein n=1 Tax=Halocaridina rubra TaxID=373956 RepID=A0AAN8WRS3_HALRR
MTKQIIEVLIDIVTLFGHLLKEEHKIVMVGLDNAGKTTILYQLLMNEVVHTSPTIGSNVEEVVWKNLHFIMWDLGGQESLRSAWNTYYTNTEFVIVVIDSTDRERLGITREELYKMLAHEELSRAAVLIYANKQDIKGSMSAAEISRHLNLTSIKKHKWQIQGCCALTGEGLYQGLEWIGSTLKIFKVNDTRNEMTRIAALNDFDVGSSDEEDAGPTREVLEAEATKNYNAAIRMLASGNLNEAYELFCLVLENPYVEKACWPEGVEPGGILPQDLALRFSCLKNIGNLACKRGDYDQSIEYYVEAVKLDSTDVTLWQRLGAAAIKLRDFELALVAFQEGYTINPKHWPCLDQLLSVLFILKMYMDCLGLAIHSLQRDPGYIKALAFKDKIFELQPSLKEDVKLFLKDSSILFKEVNYDKTKGDKFITTCETLRPPNKSPMPPTTIPSQHLRKPLSHLSWDDLGQSLLSTYDELIEEDGMAFAGKIDIYKALKEVQKRSDRLDTEDLGALPLENCVEVEQPNMRDVVETNGYCEVSEKCGEKDKTSPADTQENPSKISGRRRTIELGESQDSFRVSEKRRSTDSDTSHSEDNKADDKPVDGESDQVLPGKESGAEKVTNEFKEELQMDSMPDINIREKEKTVDNEEKVDSTVKTKPEENLKDKNEERISKDQAVNIPAKQDDVDEKPEVGASVKPSGLECESDNDFQGFTNTSTYKDKHLKLMQGKSNLNITTDDEDYGTDLSEGNQLNESGYAKPIQDAGISEGVNIPSDSDKKHGEIQTHEFNNEGGNIPSDSKQKQGGEIQTQELNSVKVLQEDVSKIQRDLVAVSIEVSEMGSHDVGMGKVFSENTVPDTVNELDVNQVIKETHLGQDEELYAKESERTMEYTTIEDDELRSECGGNERIAENLEDVLRGNEEENFGADNDGAIQANGIEGNQANEEEVMLANEEVIQTNEDGLQTIGEGMQTIEDEGFQANKSDIVHANADEVMQTNDDENLQGNEGGDLPENDGGVREQQNIAEHNDVGVEENIESVEDEETEENIPIGNEMEENEAYQEEELEDGLDDEGLSGAEVTETEAAVNALKGIMALQPTEILGLPDPDFDYENEYVEYFDGGVYEEEEEEEPGEELEESMEQGEGEENRQLIDDSEGIDETQENMNQDMNEEQEGGVGDNEGEEANQEDYSQEEDGDQEEMQENGEEEENRRETENETGVNENCKTKASNNETEASITKHVGNSGQEDGNGECYVGLGNEELDVNIEKEDTSTNASHVRKRYSTDADDTTMGMQDKMEKTASQPTGEVARKSKRTKRGLERELEQLDYWGRRQERDAKRRRRTISSKLLGAIEEAEYLTWADLFRSFIPARLLSVSNEKVSESDTTTTNVSDDQTTTSKERKDESSVLVKDATTVPLLISSASNDKQPTSVNSENQKGDDVIEEKMNERSATADANLKDNSPAGENANDIIESRKDTETEGTDATPLTADNAVVVDQGLGIEDVVCQRDEAVLSAATEEDQVQAFLLRFEENGGILHLLQQFVRILLRRHKNHLWPISAAKMFTQSYPRVRNHLTLASPLDIGENRKRLYEESVMSLTHWELVASIHQSSKLSTSASDGAAPSNPFTGVDDHLEEDMFRLTLMLGRGDVWAEEAPEFHTRLRWLQAQIRIIRGQPEEAATYLELLSSDLERLSNDGKEYVCNRVRVENDSVVVCNSEVKRQLNVLQRSHMLEQVVGNFTDGRYREVADLLTSIFHEPLPKSRPGVTLPIRQTQLAILIDSLYKLAEYKDVIIWGSQALTEALMRYNRAEAEEEKTRWAKTLMKITDTINMMLTDHISIVEEVQQERMIELVSTLISMLVVQLDKPQSAQLLPFETLTPWILLHRILSCEESRSELSESKNTKRSQEPSETDTENGTKVEKETDVSSVVTASTEGLLETKNQELSITPKGPLMPYPSTLFLITAHDELGKHSWCCYDEGVFLLYCLDAILVELQRKLDNQHRQLLHHTLEQVTFCLYSHPSKKSKHKHLRDHGVPQIAFCWERAMQLYQYYRPYDLPDFQTSVIPSITDDAAALFKRISALLPDDAKPAEQMAAVDAYINGDVAECSYMPFSPPTNIIKDCFYLLGDYYFKGKEWTNAIKYYKLDVSINNERLESWAPLGLAMKAMLESQLNSCEVIEDEEAFFSLAKAAVQCLRRALTLDRYHTNLWVEFGGLVYMVHSHASRLLKQDLNPDISMETFDMLEKLKSEMLNQAEVCFTRALSIQEECWEDEGLPDERWLHCYMLGKVAEKQSKPPLVIIQYYNKAAGYLHNIRARYPNRINYNSPQEYSVEALEMYYRVHAYVLKYLHQREGRDVEPDILETFTKALDELAKGPFATCKEKKNSDENDCGVDCSLENQDTTKKRPIEDSDVEEPLAKKPQNHGTLESTVETQDKENDLTPKNQDEDATTKTSTENVKKESDDEIEVVEEKVLEKKKDHFTVLSRCLMAMRMCLSRFQENYKAMYRLSQYYHTSKFHKDNSKAQNYLLGCAMWQNVGYMPVNGLFHERKVWIQQPRNCNFFHGVWRIPNDEIDRPGSFAAHMYRCISLILDILPQTRDFFMILQIALALKNSPDKDKKYLRDNERELLSEHATQVGLQVMKDKYKVLFKGTGPVNTNRHLRFLLEVYKSYKQISKHLLGSEPHFAKMLTDTYASYKDIKMENRSSVLREADSFCHRQQHLHPHAPMTALGTSTHSSTSTYSNTGDNSTTNTIQSTLVSRRGRPPLTNRGRGRGRGYVYNTAGRTVGDILAVNQAYKIYENLLASQRMLTKQDITQSQLLAYKKQIEDYQNQLMKYLTIPCVSHYFTSSLQNMGSSISKLPPPPSMKTPSGSTSASSSVTSPQKVPDNTNPTVTKLGSSNSAADAINQETFPVSKISNPPPGQIKSSLISLAAKSKAHGISITSVSSSKTQAPNAPVKSGMLVTVSPAKSNCPPAFKGRDVSVISISSSAKTSPSLSISKTEGSKLLPSSATSKTSTNINTPDSSSTTSSTASVPKLPAGTTIIRPQKASPNRGSGPRPQLQATPRQKTNTQPGYVPVDINASTNSTKFNESISLTKSSSSVVNKPTLPKGMSVTPTPRNKPQAKTVPSSPSTSFLQAFEASLGINSSKNSPNRSPSVPISRGSSSLGMRPVNKPHSTSVTNASGKVTQLSTQQLLNLAYNSQKSSGGRDVAPPTGVTSLRGPDAKAVQQQKGQTKPLPTPQLPQGSTISRVQHPPLKSQTSTALSVVQKSVSQKNFSNSQQPKPGQPQSINQTKIIPKTNPAKPSQKPGDTSNDIITLD